MCTVKTPRRLFSGLLALLLLAFSAGCGQTSQDAFRQLVGRGKIYHFRPITFNVAPFLLTGLLKNQGEGDLVVYLEGDGRGVVRGRVTMDPTPSQVMGFDLARSDPAAKVLYLARVGQFQATQNGPAYMAYWSDKRLAEESVEAASQAINKAKLEVGAARIHLIGYSGGGGLAALLAERRGDVLSLTTVAGLLDTYWWVRQKRYRPLAGSLNPADQAENLANVSQIHFYGEDDSIIPPEMSAHFQSLAVFTDFRRVGQKTNHWRAWPELWPLLLERYVLPARLMASH
jgi:pimeloyl-ACP methyl ester carboxylesterase